MGKSIVVKEVRLNRGHPAVGKTLKELDLGKNTGAIVAARWKKGRIECPITADITLSEGDILILVGSHKGVEKALEFLQIDKRRDGKVFILGYGEIGKKVAEILNNVGEQIVTIDINESQKPDITGNAIDMDFLQKISIKDAEYIVISIGSDDRALMATLALRANKVKSPIAVRVYHSANIDKFHSAGADYTVAIGQVTSQVLQGMIFGKSALELSKDFGIKAYTLPVSSIKIKDLKLREKLGLNVVAIERDNKVIVDINADMELRKGDKLYIIGKTQRLDELDENWLQGG